MKTFFKQSQMVDVSRISKDGWWIENTTEHVTKGTALGDDFTQTQYTPSSKGMIARYDRAAGLWSDEIEDKTWTPYWGKHGEALFIGEPDGDYPEWAIKDAPPEYNQDTHTVLHDAEHGWAVYEIKIGTSFYDELGREFIVSDYNFTLPGKSTWDKPPKANKGHAVKWIDGQWQQLIDHRNKLAYAKDRDNAELQDYQVEVVGPLPATHTLKEPEQFDSWKDDEAGWQYDIERHRPFKVMEEKQWRDEEITKVINRIDQYEKDQHYPVELRTSPINNEADFLTLLADRKALSDYPTVANFPFSNRPKLSGLAQ